MQTPMAMDTTHALYDLAPIAHIALVGLLFASAPLTWVWLRSRGAPIERRLAALSAITLFLTFDLVVFGAFTRLTDSGLGCPDWPGCYGNASPLGAHHEIAAAQSAMPTGPVTHGKAWIEMTHRYLATGVGALIVVLAVGSWLASRRHRLVVSPWWATFTLAWVCLQGAFGAWTVTMKLYPAIVTAHLLGGLGLLTLLAIQTEGYRAGTRWASGVDREVERHIDGRWRAGVLLVVVMTWMQATLGGWVSTNYAVLACTDFPGCQGSLWPPMDFAQGFTILRPLGLASDGSYLGFDALTAIHYAHRLMAYAVFAVTLVLAARFFASGEPSLRRWARVLVALMAWQLLSGLANVVLGWPLAAAVAHTAGAAAWVTLSTVLLVRIEQGRRGIEGSPAQASLKLPSRSEAVHV